MAIGYCEVPQYWNTARVSAAITARATAHRTNRGTGGRNARTFLRECGQPGFRSGTGLDEVELFGVDPRLRHLEPVEHGEHVVDHRGRPAEVVVELVTPELAG